METEKSDEGEKVRDFFWRKSESLDLLTSSVLIIAIKVFALKIKFKNQSNIPMCKESLLNSAQ